ncbi:MAG: heme ABC transporter ATP-binding protein [Spirochaeta sp. LUC14_002_19_P3]|nr:MAG: heme ABC transporter ATP-binding protein [Spirochaeta sp. LUC14_002_19_P3]
MARIQSLEMRGISKSFLEVKANRDINLSIHAGEILGLLGENGAGKTTLMNILYGLYLPDEGDILVNGEPIRLRGPKDSMRAGIGMIHQHFMLVDKHTVLENIALGFDEAPFFFPHRAIRKKIEQLSDQYGLRINPDKPVWNLSAGEQQRVEIIKALSRNADLLIMDEPTSVLTPQEADELFEILRKMILQGHSVILISHKLEEIMSICDRVMVLRKGCLSGEASIEDVDKGKLAEMMIGRQIAAAYDKADVKPGGTVLDIQDLHVDSDRGLPAVRGLSVQIHSSEILGIAGVSGNGQQELVETITGLRQPLKGSVTMMGQPLKHVNARDAHTLGITHVPEERIKFGIVPNLPLYENSVLKQHRDAPYSSWLRMDYPVIKNHAGDLVNSFQVDTPSVNARMKNLSGGNIQKLILGREISSGPNLLIAAHPTYGLDVGAAEYVRKQIIALRDKGGSVLLVSEDLDELFMVCDRIAVMFEGEFMGELTPDTWTIEKIGLMMAGSHG